MARSSMTDLLWFLFSSNSILVSCLAVPFPVSPKPLNSSLIERRKNYHPPSKLRLVQDEFRSYPYHYVAEVEVPSNRPDRPSQKFHARFDTTIADFVVPGARCRDCQGDWTTKYDEHGGPVEQVEQDQRVPGSEHDWAHNLNGVVIEDYVMDEFTDDLSVGDYTIKDMNVVSVTEMRQGATTFNDVMESTVGLGFKNIPGGTHRPSFFERLVIDNNNDPTAAPEISFFFGREASPGQRSTESMSEMSIGGRNDALVVSDSVQLQVVPTPDSDQGPKYWSLPLLGFVLDGADVAASIADYAILDTGSPLIIAPGAIANKFYEQWGDVIPIQVVNNGFGQPPASGAMPPQMYDYWAFNCRDAPDVQIFLGTANNRNAYKFEMNFLDISLGKINTHDDKFRDAEGSTALADARNRGEDLCWSAIVGSKSPPAIGNQGDTWVLGTAFLKNWYTTFAMGEPPTVTLAKALEGVSPGAGTWNPGPDLIEVVVERPNEEVETS